MNGRKAPDGFGYAAHDGPQSIGIILQADCPTDGMLTVVAMPLKPENHRHGALTSFVKAVPVVVQVQVDNVGSLATRLRFKA